VSDDPEHTFVRLHSVTLREDARGVGKSLGDCQLDEVGAEVHIVRRGRERIEATRETVLHAGDVVVLRGSADAVARAEERLA
jgi:monovalent cation:H+ antiporter-2, CPA2 family